MVQMEKLVVKAEKRDVTGKKVRALRREGKLPAVMYGSEIDSMPIVLDARSASRVLMNVTSSSVVMVSLDGKEYPALVRERQRDVIRGNLLHVDFQVVSLTEKIRAKVGIELVGEAPAVKDFNAVIVTGMDALEVESLPQELPERIEVDISSLKEIGDGIFVRDIVVSDKVEILDDPDAMIVFATGGREEEAPAEETEEGLEAESVEPEVIERGSKEEEEEA
jgi:large subunit ribosomal protein L25